MTEPDPRIARLQRRLEQRADVAVKEWWERYLRGAIAFRGVPMDGVRRAANTWFEEERLELLAPEDQVGAALDLLRQLRAEDKLAGILMLGEILLPAGALDWRRDLTRIGALFDQGHVHEWNTCDWLCVKVLGPLALRYGEACARSIAGWRSEELLWKRRAAAVAFVNLARGGDENFPGFTTLLLDTCAALLADERRFSQNGAGWALRELSRAEPREVEAFLEARIESLSREAIKRAVARLPDDARKQLLDVHASVAGAGRRSM